MLASHNAACSANVCIWDAHTCWSLLVLHLQVALPVPSVHLMTDMLKADSANGSVLLRCREQQSQCWALSMNKSSSVGRVASPCSTAHACVSSDWHQVRATSGWQMAIVITDNSGLAAESVCMAECCMCCMQPSQGSAAMPLIASAASADGQAGTNTAAVGSWAGAK